MKSPALTRDFRSDIYRALNICAACKSMCMGQPGEEHLRYRHAHRIGQYVVCISVQSLRRRVVQRPLFGYGASVTEVSTGSTGLLIPLGYYPMAASDSQSILDGDLNLGEAAQE
ncbi:hypothetical protein OH77DRAFT_232303 [Trametes cingulata]|nr:hypothetical protein OH77DRAFT_232303 [Trametes cingulata]